MGLKVIRMLKAMGGFIKPKMEDLTYDEFSALEQKKHRLPLNRRDYF